MSTYIGIIDSDSSETLDGIRNHSIVHAVKIDRETEASFAAQSTSGIPAVGDSHPEDPNSIAVNATTRRSSDDYTVYHVTVDYTNNPPNPNTVSASSPPSAVTPTESWGVEDYEAEITRDRDGERIVNTAKYPYPKKSVVTLTLPTLNLTRAESYYLPATAYAYNNSVNDAVFAGAEAGKIRVTITAEMAFRNGFPYYVVAYKFRYNPRGWALEHEERGFYYFDPTNPTVPVRMTTKGSAEGDSEPTTEPGYLDATGLQIPQDDILTGAQTPEVTEWEYLTPLDYSALGLGF